MARSLGQTPVKVLTEQLPGASLPDESPHPVRWDRSAYYRLGEQGFLDGRTELIDGEIYSVSPQGRKHSHRVVKVARVLEHCDWVGVWVQVQMPVDLGIDSEPEPDLAVLPGDVDDYVESHPTSPLLIVEVSDTSLAHDQGRKASLYARSGIIDYWIVNVPERVLEVRRGPKCDSSLWSYESVTTFRPGDSVSPLAAPGVSIEVARLFEGGEPAPRGQAG